LNVTSGSEERRFRRRSFVSRRRRISRRSISYFSDSHVPDQNYSLDQDFCSRLFYYGMRELVVAAANTENVRAGLDYCSSEKNERKIAAKRTRLLRDLMT